jgi:predicted translin family RNA/ssDNA-binding protein
LAFSPGVADGTGELARACVQNGTQAKVCTAAW